MIHKVDFRIPQRELGNVDVEFDVYTDTTKLGTLKVSRGDIEWVPRDFTYGHKLKWKEFDVLMKQQEKES
jgi:homogentisate 1,2-dioxygenase